MENLKIQIKIEDNDNLKEVHGLLLELGFSTYSKESFGVWADQPKPIWLKTNVFDDMPSKIDWSSKESHGEYKEITLPELRDLVVLKRNDVGDATHVGKDLGIPYFVTSSGDVKVWDKKGWVVACATLDNLKPIEKTEMKAKEYLNKETYAYVKTHDLVSKDSNWIEIPEGAEIYLDPSCNVYGFYKDNFKQVWCETEWEDTVHNSANLQIWKNMPVLWQRHTLPEELPFIDDEPKEYLREDGNGSYILELTCKQEATEPHAKHWIEVPVGVNFYYSFASGDKVFTKEHSSLGRLLWQRKPPFSINNQYAEIDKVRQSAWNKQEGGSHYKNLKIQPMQYALENKLDYAQANVVKYVTRHKEKNGKEDLLKAIHNLELMIEFYYGDEK